MTPGRELDALVAEKVMGYRVLSRWDADGTIKHLVDENQCEVDPPEFPHFSTDIAVAWEVLEKLRTDNAAVHLLASSPALKGEGHFRCIVWAHIELCYDANAATAPHAICLAALRAVE